MSAKVVVLGGGAAGVVVANELARRGAAVELLERAPRLGGLHRSIAIDGMHFDIGAFVFSKEHELVRSFPFLLEAFTVIRPRIASITPRGTIDRYPLSLRGYFRDNGARVGMLSIADYFVSKAKHRRRDTVPAFTQYLVGEQIYRRSGLQRYIERLFGMPDHELGLEFARQRLPEIQAYAPSRVAGRMVLRTFLQLGRSGPVEEVALVRPPEGFDSAYALIRAHLEQNGVRVRTGCDIRSIRRAASGFEVVVGDEVRTCDRVVSTIPIPISLRLAGMDTRARLDTIGVCSLFYTGKLVHDRSVLYNFTFEGRWKRLTAFSSYYGKHAGLDYWTVEATTRDVSQAMTDELRADFEEHAHRLGLCDGVPAYVGAHVTERAYPVFHRGEGSSIETERARLAEAGVDYVGRQGAFEYLSSHAAARNARRLAEKIARGSESGT